MTTPPIFVVSEFGHNAVMLFRTVTVDPWQAFVEAAKLYLANATNPDYKWPTRAFVTVWKGGAQQGSIDFGAGTTFADITGAESNRDRESAVSDATINAEFVFGYLITAAWAGPNDCALFRERGLAGLIESQPA